VCAWEDDDFTVPCGVCPHTCVHMEALTARHGHISVSGYLAALLSYFGYGSGRRVFVCEAN
jgi:hypothetical protein